MTSITTGVKDAAEVGLAGAVVQLYRSDADNTTNSADDVAVGSSVTTTADNRTMPSPRSRRAVTS